MKYLKLITVFFFAILCAACRSHSPSRLDTAEELLRQEKYDQAIDLYKAHMQTRLRALERPEWENPYFYHLLIGDIELRRANVQAAIENYKIAESRGIHPSLISDRMRYVASWYEEKGELDQAVEILKENRALDPLLFDAMLDRISKEIIYRQDKNDSKN